MKRKISILAGMAFAASATFAAAEEHVIFYLGDAFFPEVSYVKPGDVVRFVNSSSLNMTIVSTGSEWSVGPVAVDAFETINVSQDIKKTFFGDSEGSEVEGRLSFEPAPLG